MAFQFIKNRFFRITAITLAIIFLITLVLQNRAKNYIVNILDKKIPDHIQLEYDKIEVNLLSGSIHLSDVSLDMDDKETGENHAQIRMEAFSIEGIGYFNYLFGNNVGAHKLKILRPKVNYYSDDYSGKINEELPKGPPTEKVFTLNRLEIVEGEIKEIKNKTDTIKFRVEKLNLSVQDLKTEKRLFKNKMPFTYGSYSWNTGRIFLDIDPFEVLMIEGTKMNDGNELTLSNLKLKTKYERKELSQRLTKEHDHIVFEIPAVSLANIDFGFNSQRFFMKTGSVLIQDPVLAIYRNKLVADDMEPKKLYSRKLREMQMDLDISKIIIENGHISYSELVAAGTEAGELMFSDLAATLNNVSNTYENGGETNIEIRTRLMGHAPVDLNWKFDSSQESDAFYITGEVKDFQSESINQFLQSNLRAKAEGDIKELYFTISGDAISSSGDMKMKYQDFHFTVLKKNRLGVNKLLTFVGNMLTNDGSKTDALGYRHGEIYAEREPTKSFFNYLWLNVMDGMLDTLTGDGKKE